MSKLLQKATFKGGKDRFGVSGQAFESACISLHSFAASMGLSYVQPPLWDPRWVYERAAGEDSDIVKKEMFSLADSNIEFPGAKAKTGVERLSGGEVEGLTGQSTSEHVLRPEGTANLLFALQRLDQLGASQSLPSRYYYLGPMFRRENPQRGRLRQFHQFGVELLHSRDRLSEDLEIFRLASALISKGPASLFFAGPVKMRVNSLGDSSARQHFASALLDFFSSRPGLTSSLSAEGRARLKHNPLRLFDTKNPDDRRLLTDAPRLRDFLSAKSRSRFEKLLEAFAFEELPFVEDPLLVRGLDYYNDFCFEASLESADAGQSTLLAGGRFDGLASLLGPKKSSGVGFAFGLDRYFELGLSPRKLPVPPSHFITFLIEARDDESSANRLSFAHKVMDTIGISPSSVEILVIPPREFPAKKKEYAIKSPLHLVISDREMETEVVELVSAIEGRRKIDLKQKKEIQDHPAAIKENVD